MTDAVHPLRPGSAESEARHCARETGQPWAVQRRVRDGREIVEAVPVDAVALSECAFCGGEMDGAHGVLCLGCSLRASNERQQAKGAETMDDDECSRCDGEGRIANSEEGEPWSAWAELPPGSDLAVQMGVVQPMDCPDCGGAGKRGGDS